MFVSTWRPYCIIVTWRDAITSQTSYCEIPKQGFELVIFLKVSVEIGSSINYSRHIFLTFSSKK